MTQQDITALTEIITNTQSQLSQQLTEFKTELDDRFDQIDQRFNKLEFRMDRFEGRLEQFEHDTRIGFERVTTTLDGIASRLDIDDSERVAVSAQVTRHEDWIVEAAPSTGVKYVPGA